MLKNLISLLSILFLFTTAALAQDDSVRTSDSLKTIKTIGFKTMLILTEEDTSTTAFQDSVFVEIKKGSKYYRVGVVNLVGNIDEVAVLSQIEGWSYFVFLPNVDIDHIRLRLANKVYIPGRKLKYKIILQK